MYCSRERKLTAVPRAYSSISLLPFAVMRRLTTPLGSEPLGGISARAPRIFVFFLPVRVLAEAADAAAGIENEPGCTAPPMPRCLCPRRSLLEASLAGA